MERESQHIDENQAINNPRNLHTVILVCKISTKNKFRFGNILLCLINFAEVNYVSIKTGIQNWKMEHTDPESLQSFQT